MKKEVKDTIITELGEKLKEYPHFYLVDVTGLNKAFEASELDYEPLYGVLKGNTAIMFSHVANIPAKLLKEYKKEGIPALKAAYAEESMFIGADKL